jgi:hypothetical protein
MRIQHRYLTFEKDSSLTELLDQYTVRYKTSEKSFDSANSLYSLEFMLYEDNPRFTEIQRAVEYFGLQSQVGTLYDKQDYDDAEWFILRTGQYQYPQPESSYLEMTFNLDEYCTFCDIGRMQNAPFRLKSAPKNHNQFWGLHWVYDAIFVRQQAKDILAKLGLRGVRFSHPVIHKTQKPVEGFYQFHIENDLAQGFDPYNSRMITCKFGNEENSNFDPTQFYCGRVKYQHPMIGGYLFPHAMFKGECEIFQTFEYFGSGASASRLHIVSKRIRKIIEANILKGANFIPVSHHRISR